jgi:hypothetical protein
MIKKKRISRKCPNRFCTGRQYLRTTEKGKVGTYRCYRCGRVDLDARRI